jgi:hypothetical protein
MAIQLSTIFSGGRDTGMSGTGKRAYYAMLSRNTSSTWNGAVFYDRNIVGNVLSTGYPSSYAATAGSNIVFNNNTTYQYADQVWSPVTATQNNSGGNATATYVNATNACGEFGNAMIDAYSDGTISNILQRQNASSVKHTLNACAINSDHSNRRIVYLLISGRVRAVDRLYGSFSYPMSATSDFVVSSLNSNMQGSASYNANRKELTILSYVGATGSFNCFTFSNVDFDAYPDPAIALNRPEVTRTNAALSLATGWAMNDNESQFNLKPVTTNFGSVYVSVMFSTNNFSLYRFTRSGTSAITATRPGTLSTTTTYGLDQGVSYGQRTITSRDGTTVAAFCPYYIYGTGIECYMIDKTNDTYTAYNNNDSSFGVQIIPYADSGWAFYYAGNGYAGNYSGSYIANIFTRTPTIAHRARGENIFFTVFTGPNTTNYPGITQVVDYVLVPDNRSGLK